MPLRTRLTEKLGISHPILLAPMGTASGGALAKAVTEAGGLGTIGFGYGNPERIDQSSPNPAAGSYATAGDRPGRSATGGGSKCGRPTRSGGTSRRFSLSGALPDRNHSPRSDPT